jgi:hypothetical protein
VFASVAGEVAVVAVDHRQAGAHAAGEVEGGDAGTEGDGGEGVSEIVDPAQRLCPCRVLCRLPVVVAELCRSEVAAPARRGTAAGCADSRAGVRSPQARSLAAARPAGSLAKEVSSYPIDEQVGTIAVSPQAFCKHQGSGAMSPCSA